jgi:hypothetical protein
MSKQTIADSIIRSLYDYSQPLNKEGAISQISEDVADAWDAFFQTEGAGILGSFPTLSGSTTTELGCMQIMANYCLSVHNNLLKPLAGLPYVDLLFRIGQRNIVNLWAMYQGLRINTIAVDDSDTIFTIDGENLWGKSVFDMPEPGTEGYTFLFAFWTNDPEHFITSVDLKWYIEGEGDQIEHFEIATPGKDDEQTWEQAYLLDLYAEDTEIDLNQGASVLLHLDAV